MALDGCQASESSHPAIAVPSDVGERHALFAALDSFRQYRQAAHYNITHLRRLSFYSLPSAHMDILSEEPFSLPRVFDAVDDAIDSNADLAEAILSSGLALWGIDTHDDSWQGRATPGDLDKARSTLRQFYRDWSAEGMPERHAAYSSILTALNTYLPLDPAEHLQKQRVLVPGAGLGRLLFDLHTAGYAVEGNEISQHQLLASNYILHCTPPAMSHQLYPWALNFNNHLTRSAQLTHVAVPDIHPRRVLESAAGGGSSDVHRTSRLSMTAGDFCQVYQRRDYHHHFDAVVTCFFIDTAPNLMLYIETIAHCLNVGGLWLNVGPLLWHFDSAPSQAEREQSKHTSAHVHSEPNGTQEHEHHGHSTGHGLGQLGSFELSHDEVIALVERCGFEILEQHHSLATGYVQDPESMLQNVYRPSFWVARRK